MSGTIASCVRMSHLSVGNHDPTAAENSDARWLWTVHIKDVVTGVIALGTLIIAITTFFNSYLRRPQILSTPATWIWLAAYPEDDTKFRIFDNVLFYNKGAGPALITSLNLRLIPDQSATAYSTDVIFQWHEFVSRQEVRDPGAMYAKGNRAVFEGEAFALVVPRTDTIVKEIVFFPVGRLTEGHYTLVLEGEFIGHKGRLRRFHSLCTRLTITKDDLALVKARVARNSEEDKYLYSNQVRISSAPASRYTRAISRTNLRRLKGKL